MLGVNNEGAWYGGHMREPDKSRTGTIWWQTVIIVAVAVVACVLVLASCQVPLR